MPSVPVPSGLRPDPDQAEDWLRRELAHPDYHQRTIVERIRDWVLDLFDRMTTAASGASPLATFAAIVVAVVVIAVLLYAVPRIRRTPAADATWDRGVLTERDVTAAELRSRAERAVRERRHEDAVGDAFRALALRMVERGTIELTVGSTAHELADRMVARFPAHTERLLGAADLFDAVVYGDHPASSDDAARVLLLDDDLRSVRPTDDAALRSRSLVVPR